MEAQVKAAFFNSPRSSFGVGTRFQAGESTIVDEHDAGLHVAEGAAIDRRRVE